MGTINLRLSDADTAILQDLAKDRGTPGETILSGVLHDFLQHQAAQMANRKSGTALSTLGEFAPEAEVAALCGSDGTGASWGRTRGG